MLNDEWWWIGQGFNDWLRFGDDTVEEVLEREQEAFEKKRGEEFERSEREYEEMYGHLEMGGA